MSSRRPSFKHAKTRRIFVGLLAGLFTIMLFHHWQSGCPPIDDTIEFNVLRDGLPNAMDQLEGDQNTTMTFQNLNAPLGQAVLIMTIIKSTHVEHLTDFFKLIETLTYPQLTLALLMVNPAPATIHAVRQHMDRARITVPIKLYGKSFDDPVRDTLLYELQPLRRSVEARARNYLLASALTSDYSHVLWLDPLLSSVEPTLAQDLIRVDVDIVVPNTMVKRKGLDWGFDERNWQETEMSLALQEQVPEDFIFLEGFIEFQTHRLLMIDMNEENTLVTLDGVGPSCILVKAHVHRDGINFPAFAYHHQIDTEGFAKVANTAGYGVYGLPGYKVFHKGHPDDEEESE